MLIDFNFNSIILFTTRPPIKKEIQNVKTFINL